MINSGRRQAANLSYRKVRAAAGRWSLFRAGCPTPEDAIERARYDDAAAESEDRVQVRGGRLISGFGGEQFALPEVLDSLRAARIRN